EFKTFLKEENIEVSEKDFAANREEISRQLRLELVTMIYGSNEADRDAAGTDPLVLTAAGNLDRAKELASGAKRFMASKEVQKSMPESLEVAPR
ncbi:MAG: hypothetical protein ACM3NO_08460, partial [Deltaproteobacteria bacterium]